VFGAIFALNQNNGPGGSADNFYNYAKTVDPTVASSRPNADTIIMSTDPVAAEMQAIKVQKLNNNSAYTTAAMPDYLKISGGVASGSLAPVLNIGTINEAQMTIWRIINGVNMSAVEYGPTFSKAGLRLTVSPNPARNLAHFEIWTPESLVGQKALLEVYDARGRVAFKSTPSIMGARNTVAWNGRDKSGRLAAPGKYVVYLMVGKEVLHSALTLLR
jgi:hypothetical protein